jgi:integrase
VQTVRGERDDALLRLLYNTGMRAQEVVSLDVNHLRLSRPYCVRIHGKGRKERTCPLWKETVHALKSYLERRAVALTDAVPLFVNGDGNRPTRFGVRYIVAHRVAEAASSCPSLLTRRITPHTWRHYLPLLTMSSDVGQLSRSIGISVHGAATVSVSPDIVHLGVDGRGLRTAMPQHLADFGQRGPAAQHLGR